MRALASGLTPRVVLDKRERRDCLRNACAASVGGVPGKVAKNPFTGVLRDTIWEDGEPQPTSVMTAVDHTGSAVVQQRLDRSAILLRELNLSGMKGALIITFKDTAAPELETLTETYRQKLGIPVAVVDARNLQTSARSQVVKAITTAHPLISPTLSVELPKTPVRDPGPDGFRASDCRAYGRIDRLVGMFAVPIYAAYQFASWAQGPVDETVITPFEGSVEPTPAASLPFGSESR